MAHKGLLRPGRVKKMARQICRLLPHVSIAVVVASWALAGALKAPMLCAQDDADNAVVVRTTDGLIRGIPRPGGGAEFLGIPYAQPPVGRLRWHEPEPPRSWDGIRDTREFASACAQPVLGEWNRRDAETSSEDCLYLNVITPIWRPRRPLPVFLWIHGGANVGGSGAGDLFATGTLPDHGVILVTFNYRLGVFGFFAHPALTQEAEHHESGNYALMDQIAALHWVIENISRFGGDPKNITVGGQSAGAEDTGLLMTSRAKGWFHKAIAESGTPLLVKIPPLSAAEAAGEAFAVTLHTPAGDAALPYLRGLSTQVILQAAVAADPRHHPQIGPDIDGWVLPQAPAAVFAAGQESPIPLLIGSNTIESGSTDTLDSLRAAIKKYAGGLAPQALQLYGLANGGAGMRDPLYGSVADQWSADTRFRCPATTLAQWHTEAKHPVYVYQFDRAIPGHEAQGARHSGELPYVFGAFSRGGGLGGNYSRADSHLAFRMQTYWSNFMKTGNPNVSSLPRWPEFNGMQQYMEFTEDCRAEASHGPQRPAQCGLYRQMLAQRMKQGQ